MLKAVIPLFLLFLVSCSQESIYDLKLKALDGSEFSLSAFKGRPFALYVWSGTCIGHIEDLKFIQSNYKDISSRIPLVSVAIMMDEEDIKKVLKENSIEPSFPLLADPTGKISEMVVLVFLPSTLIFNETGELIKSYPKFPQNISILFQVVTKSHKAVE